MSDLYDGFLSAEDRRGVNPPEEGTIPPLVKWGNPSFGPYTFPTDATASFGAKSPGNLVRHATYLPSIAFATDDGDEASDGTQPSAKAIRPSRRPS